MRASHGQDARAALDPRQAAQPAQLTLVRSVPVEKGRPFPAQPTPLVGREGELELARRTLMRDEVRLLTFRGPAGAGKTRLAMATAGSLQDFFEDGVHVVDLAPLEHYDQVFTAIAEVVRVREMQDQPVLQRLAAALANSNALLVLDNFEHVMPAADQVGALLSMCPSIRILVTSREALRLRWEYVFPVGPLPLPAPHSLSDPERLVESPAIRLFVERAKAADATFELTSSNAASVAELCIRLDGLPLALELAAARTPMLPPAAFLSRLRHRLDLLVDGAHDLPERQQSVRAAVGYSYDLLSPEEQTLFRLLSVFAGGCAPEAVAAIVDDVLPGTDPADQAYGPILDRMAALAHKSLLVQEPQTDGEIRFRMLETVRAYAAEQLLASGDQAVTRQRALTYFCALAAEADRGLHGAQQGTWLERLEREYDNMRAALRWAIDSGDTDAGIELAGRLGQFFELKGLYTEGRAWLKELLAQPAAAARTAARALALGTAARLAACQGDDPSAELLGAECLALQKELGDRAGYATCLSTLAVVAYRRGDAARARTVLEESLAIRRELGDAWGIASVLHQLGDVASEPGQYPIARARYEESLVEWHSLGDAWGVAMSLESMGCLAQARGDASRALRLIGAASAIFDGPKAPSPAPMHRLRLQQAIVAAESGLGAESAAVARAAGRGMSIDEALLFARTAQEQAPQASVSPLLPEGPLAWLTRREQEVATLLLRGLSNRQIAEELVITERTAETHVCRILSKLGLGSRAQIAAWVMDRSVAEDRARAS